MELSGIRWNNESNKYKAIEGKGASCLRVSFAYIEFKSLLPLLVSEFHWLFRLRSRHVPSVSPETTLGLFEKTLFRERLGAQTVVRRPPLSSCASR
jgi:hypothetical protein